MCHSAVEGGKVGAVFGAVVGRHLHAQQQYPRAGLLASPHHGAQIVFGHAQGQATQGVIAAELNDQYPRLVLAQQCGQARASAGGGVAADAGIDHAVPARFGAQLLLQQGHPAAAAFEPILGTQRVAHHQHACSAWLGNGQSGQAGPEQAQSQQGVSAVSVCPERLWACCGLVTVTAIGALLRSHTCPDVLKIQHVLL